MRWRRRSRTRPADGDADLTLPPDLATVFLATVWLRQWADDLTVVAQWEDFPDRTRYALREIAATIAYAAERLADGHLEPGGEIYERLTRDVPVEP